MDGAFLDWALESFSGYVAADELYEGPYCVLSVVDNRAYKRILYEVLDHDPTHNDITALLQRLKRALTARNLALQGITTDGSPLYPEPIRAVFGDVAHQIFRLVKPLNGRHGLRMPADSTPGRSRAKETDLQHLNSSN